MVPIYHEDESALEILSKLPPFQVDTLCVVIDEPSVEIIANLRKVALRLPAVTHIIKNGKRMGIGFSLRQAFDYLLKSEHRIIVVIAGNGKDNPTEISRLIEPVRLGGWDYVQGSRYLAGGTHEKMPFVRRVFNRLYPLLWTILTGRKCTDVTNGYRCYSASLLKDSRINLRQEWLNGYSLEYYIHFKALHLGYRVKEVPVSKRYRFGHKGGYSKIQPLKDWWPIISPLILLVAGIRD